MGSAALVCVQPAVCERLAATSGGASPCTYEDKTAWLPGEAIPDVACPPGGAALGMCGGSCGACPAGTVCTGRSPTHPFGVCARTRLAMNHLDQCGPRTSFFLACEDPTDACASFHTSADLAKLAATYGFCVPSAQCRGLRSALPGGLDCKDASGAELP